jgi:putative salt-induced outer membrane protein YdiY
VPVLRERRRGIALMRRSPAVRRPVVLLLAAAAAAAAPARGEEAAKADGWTDVAEFSFVATGGNAETSTLGFKNALGRAWDKSSFELKAGGVRAETTTTARFAVGTDPSSFLVVETSSTDRTAENYYLNGRFDRKMTDAFYWFAGGGWDRNRFAGIQNRYAAAAGLGNVWVARDAVQFRTDYAVTFTRQDDVIAAPDADDTFAGLRFSWKYVHKFGAAAAYGNDLVIDGNLSDTDDLRADMVNWVAVSVNKRLALKVSLQWLYDNRPAFQTVELFDPMDPTAPIGTVLVELDELDTVFTASLVINF